MAVPSGVIVMWPGTAASIPSGWMRETALDARYLRGAATVADADLATDRGNTNHAHTSPSHQPTQPSHIHSYSFNTHSASEKDDAAPRDAVAGVHNHPQEDSDATTAITNGMAITVDTTSNELSWVEVIFIKSDGTPMGVPSGAYAFGASDTFLITGWARVHGDRFPKGAAASGDGGSTGGSNTHTHTSPAHTHTAQAHSHTGTTALDPFRGTANVNRDNVVDYSEVDHSHTYNTTSGTQTVNPVTTTIDSADGSPPWKKLNLLRNDTGGEALPGSIIALWGGTHAGIPSGWSRYTGMDGNFVKNANANAEAGVSTGGSSQHLHTASDCAPTTVSHQHTGVTLNTTTPPIQATDVLEGGSGDRGAITTHTHTLNINSLDGGLTHNAVAVTIDNCTSEAAFPKHRTVIFIENVPAAADKTPFSRAWLAAVLVSWQVAPPPAQSRPKLVFALPQPPFSRAWMAATLASWHIAVPRPQSRPKLVYALPGPSYRRDWLSRVLETWRPAPPQPPPPRRAPLEGEVAAPTKVPFSLRWLWSVIASWATPDPTAQRRPTAPLPAASPPEPEEPICYPRIPTAASGFTRTGVVAATFSRSAPAGSYARLGATAPDDVRLDPPGGTYDRLSPPECDPPVVT